MHRITSVTIGTGLQQVLENTFKDCTNVKKLVYAEGCTNAFRTYLTGISSATIPASVTSVEDKVFANCGDLSSIVVDASNSVYDSRNKCNAFIKKSNNTLVCGCKSTVIPNNVTRIGNNAFYGCGGLKTISIPNSAVMVGDYAFYGCNGLNDVTIGSGITKLNSDIFEGCDNVATLKYVDGCTTAVRTFLTSPSSVIIPQSVKSIEAKAFYGCEKLMQVYTGKSVETIPEGCFEGCSSLENITLGDKTKQINAAAFKGCSRITQIHSHATTPPTCYNNNVFDSNVYQDADVYVPSVNNALAAYKAANVWKNFYVFCVEDITGVNGPHSSTNVPASFINLGGQYITNVQRGINMQKMSDGTTKKVLMR